MSGPQPLSSQQGKRQKAAGGGRVKVYLHAVTDAQAELLTDAGSKCPLEEISEKTGADVEFDPHSSPVPGMKILIIRGVPSKIEEVVRLICHVTGAQDTLSEVVQTFWLQWVEAVYPDLESSAYFLPPVYFNRVPMTRQTVAGQDVMVLDSSSEKRSKQIGLVKKIGSLVKSSKTHEPQHPDVLTSNTPVTTPSETAEAFISQPAAVQESDIKDDAAMKQVLVCLQNLSEKKREILVAITRLDFGQILTEPCFTVAAAELPRASSLPPDLPQNWKQGKFDVLLIHRHYGLVVCNVMSFGNITDKPHMSKDDTVKTIRKKLRDAVSQLNKAEAMLSHLVSDVCPGLRITKTIAVPNLTTDQVQQAISHDSQLTEDLHCCLKTTKPADIAGVCLCCDHLSDPKTPGDVSSHVLQKLDKWWRRRVAVCGPDSHMTREVYKTLVARFCGPATTVSVPCTCPPRVSVKTLGQAVWCTGECYTAVITLFPEQLHLLHTQPPTLFVTGPPGTGKTVVLLLMAIQWLRCGHHVYVVSTWRGSLAACTMLYHLLLQTVNTQQSAGVSPGQPHLLQYHLDDGEDVEKAVNDLSQAASGGSLYVIADEVGSDWSHTYRKINFETLCEKLLKRVPRLHLWAASCFHGDAPTGWQLEYLSRSLRSPPAVVREVEKDEMITEFQYVHPYRERGVPDHTDGPPIRRLYHQGQGHPGDWSGGCVTCGREVASFLHSLRVGVTGTTVTPSTTPTPPCLQWRDVLVLYVGDTRDMAGLAVTRGMREAGISVRVMEDEDMEDVATARSDVVWITSVEQVLGLERKVIVHLVTEGDVDFYDRLHLMSRCTSQLVIVSPSVPECVTDGQDPLVVATESGSVSSTTQDTKTSSSPVSCTHIEELISSKVQSLWQQWVDTFFPNLQSRAYFLPPVYVNRLQMTGQEVQIHHLEATNELFCKLDKMYKHNGEVLLGISRLQLGQHLNEVSLAAAATQLLLPSRLPHLLPRNCNQGDSDVLLISRYYGIVVCEVKTISDNKQGQMISQHEMDSEIRKKLQDAALQLDEDEAMLSDLVSDIDPGLPIIKTIVFPNITTRQVQQAISGDPQLTQTLSQCLETKDASNIPGLCLCSDQLSDPMTSRDDSSDDLREFRHWWRRRVAGLGVTGQMTCDVYKALVTRFCGLATRVSVPCTCPPRVSVKTLGQAVWCTGECYTAVITLFPKQLHLLNTQPPTLFVTGPPGTGKTVVLLLMAIQWLRCGHHVYVVSTWWGSRAVCTMLYHLLLQTVNTQQSAGVSPGQPHLLRYELDDDKDMEKAVNDLSQAASEGSLYVIADEVGSEWRIKNFWTFCDKLLTQVPGLHLWAASCFHEYTPSGWQVEYLTRPLRSPPAVVREVEQDAWITRQRYVHPYSERGVSDLTDGPPVRILYHEGQGHSGDWPGDCVTCGREVASFLHSLRVGVTESRTTTSTTLTSTSDTTPTRLQWRDVLVLYWGYVSDNSGVVTGLQEAGIPVRVMTDDDIEDVATARSDVVWAARGHRVRGLERKVVVCLDDSDCDLRCEGLKLYTHSFVRFDLMSRCTSQLVIVSPTILPTIE